MLWIKSSALIVNLGWNRKVFVGDDLKKLTRSRPLTAQQKSYKHLSPNHVILRGFSQKPLLN